MKTTILILSIAAISLNSQSVAAQEKPSYAKHVRPFLAKYCLECHNAKNAKLGLNLETFKAIVEGSEGGPVLTPGKPDMSRIVHLVEGTDKPPMPPKDAKFHPKKAEIGVLRAWIAAGAKDDSADVKVAIPDIKPRVKKLAPVRAVSFSADGVEVAVARGSQLSDAATGSLLKKTNAVSFKSTISALATSQTGPWRAIALGAPGSDGAVLLERRSSNADKMELRSVDVHHTDLILDVAFSLDGKTLATGSYDTQIKLLDVASGKQRNTLKEHSDAVYGVTFSPDGKRLASCSADRAVKVFDVATGKLLYTLGEATDWLYTIAWSPDGKYIASGGVDKSIRIYAPGPQGAKLVHSVFAHQEPVQKILFSKDSKTLYSVGQGGSLKSWDVERMVERKVYDHQPETVLCMALRPDGKQIAIGRYDGVVVLLDEATGKVQAQIGAPAPARKPALRQTSLEKKPAFQVKSISPAAVARGKATRVTLDGTNLEQLDGDIKVNIPGSTIGALIGRPNPFSVELTVPATTPPGSYKFQLKTPAGATAEVPFIVDAYNAVPEKDAGGSPATGQHITLPTTIAGSLDRTGDVDFYRFDAKKGQQLGVQIVAAAIGSKVEPAVQLMDLSGRVLTESTAGHLGWTFAEAGTYAIGVRDRDLRGGANMHYRLHLGEIPVVTAIFPLGVQRGSDADIRVEGVFLGTEKVHVKAPADTALGSKIAIPLNTPRGTPLGNLQLSVGEFPESLADTITVPGTGNGVVGQPGASQDWTFHAKKGQRLIVEVNARRLGSDLDSFIEILSKDGQPVPRAVLRCQAKTFVTFRDHDSAGAGIRIESWAEMNTNDFLYVGDELLKIQDLPPGPDADCTFFNTAGQRLGFLDTTPTHHAMNTPMYKVGIHPPGTTFPANGFPVFTLYYRNDDGGPGYGRDSRIFFDPPADGEYRVRVRDSRGLGGPGHAYRLTVRPPRPSFSVRFTPTAVSIAKGGATSVAITAERFDGYDGPIALRFDNLPPGLSAPPTLIDAGTFSTAVGIYAEPGATLPAKPLPLKLVGEAAIDGQKQVKESLGDAPKLIAAGDIVTVTEEPEVTLKPGGQAKLTVRIERRAGFAGRVPVEVRGLPHGVHALDIGLNGILVNENETRRTIVIYAEPWVQAATHPFVVLAKREGKNTEHAAKSVLLKVAGK
jgi:WD40 repeat protein